MFAGFLPETAALSDFFNLINFEFYIVTTCALAEACWPGFSMSTATSLSYFEEKNACTQSGIRRPDVRAWIGQDSVD